MHITDPSVAESIVWAKNLKHSRTNEEAILYLLDEFSIDHSPQVEYPFNGLHVSKGNSIEMLGRTYPTVTKGPLFLDRELLEEIQDAINTHLPVKGAERFCNSQGIY